MLHRRPGRIRRLRHRSMLVLLAVAAWSWFGITGAVPLLIWWWHRYTEPPEGCFRLNLSRVRAARLGPWRTCIHLEGGGVVEFFNDELGDSERAALRRALKVHLARN